VELLTFPSHMSVIDHNVIVNAHGEGMNAPLSAPQRQVRLLEEVHAHRFVDVQALTELFGVSVATVRRDLSELEAQGLLRRTHGGALFVDQVTRDQANRDRTVTNVEAKRRIAKAAADLVLDGDTVIIDAGTTTLEVARILGLRSDLTIITNGLDVARELANSPGGNRLFVIGGEFHPVNHSFAGPLAAEAMRKFNADKAILSVASVDVEGGTIGVTSPQFACVQQAMIEAAKTSIVVADSSKFGRASLSVVSRLGALEYIVTDEQAPAGTDTKVVAHGSLLLRS